MNYDNNDNIFDVISQSVADPGFRSGGCSGGWNTYIDARSFKVLLEN